MDSEELFAENFDANSFIKSQITPRGTRTGSELVRLKHFKSTVNKWAVDSGESVKNNVFVNYQQFIDTAKEISHLEHEMYQLTHLLSEQSQLINRMQEMNASECRPLKELGGAFPKEKASTEEHEQQRRNLTQLSHTIDGITSMTMRADRRLLLSCVARELQAPDASTQHASSRKVYLILCNDSVIICPQYTVTATQRARRGSLADAMLTSGGGSQPSIAYKYETMFNLDNVAIGADDDKQSERNAIRLFVFPTHRIFVCDSAQQKAEWLRAFEAAKRAQLREGSFTRQATIRRSKASRSTFSPPATKGSAVVGTSLEDGDVEMDWLRELPDELDECLAQRDFDNVVELLFEGRAALDDLADGPSKSDVAEQLRHKETALVETLSAELKAACEKSTQQAGPKAARKAITLLIRLGKSSKACDLYLKHRSAAMKQACRELRIAEDPLSYQKHLTRIVLGTLCDVAAEFARLFADNAGCCSVLLLWASGEMQTYVSLLLRHIFDPAPSLGVIGLCVDTVFAQCNHLASLGLDLTFEVESLMLPAIARAVDTNAVTLVDATKSRCAEEKWRPYNLQSGANLYRFLEEMADIDLLLDDYVIDEETSPTSSSSEWQSGAIAGDDRHRLGVTHSVCVGARTLVTMCQQLPNLRLAQHESLVRSCDSTIASLVRVQLDSFARTLARDELTRVQAQTLKSSAHFLIQQVIPLAERLYAESMVDETTYAQLSQLVAEDIHTAVRQSAIVNMTKTDKAPVRHFEEIGDV